VQCKQVIVGGPRKRFIGTLVTIVACRIIQDYIYAIGSASVTYKPVNFTIKNA